MEYERQTAALLKKGGHGSSALDDTFAVSQAEKSEKVQMQLENAVDIKVHYANELECKLLCTVQLNILERTCLPHFTNGLSSYKPLKLFLPLGNILSSTPPLVNS